MPTLLQTFFLELQEKAAIWAKDLSRVRTVMPGTTKADSFPQSYFDHEKAYETALTNLLQSPHFRILSIVSGPSVLSFARALCEFDCCLCSSFSYELSDFLYTKLKPAPDLFLSDYEPYCLVLGCHCLHSRFLTAVCSLDLPPHLISNFLLLSLSLSDVGWQLSAPVWQLISHFPLFTRIEIYRRFTLAQSTSSASQISYARATRHLTFVLKRVSLTNAVEFSGAFSRAFICAPTTGAALLTDYIADMTPLSAIPILLASDLPALCVDVILCRVCDLIRSRAVVSGDPRRDVSDWPTDLASFVGRLLAEHSRADLSGFVDFIAAGLESGSRAHVCLLRALLAEVGNVKIGRAHV
jgi:hypothetical protein